MQVIRVQGQHNMSVACSEIRPLYSVEPEQAFLFLQKLSRQIGGTTSRQQSASPRMVAALFILCVVIRMVPVILNNRNQRDLDAQTFLT